MKIKKNALNMCDGTHEFAAPPYQKVKVWYSPEKDTNYK
jgi:hypothetical protein